MAPKNRLREDNEPQESTKGERLKNLRTWKTRRIKTGAGRETVFATGIKDSGIDNNGTFGDREEECSTSTHLVIGLTSIQILSANPVPNFLLLHLKKGGFVIRDFILTLIETF